MPKILKLELCNFSCMTLKLFLCLYFGFVSLCTWSSLWLPRLPLHMFNSGRWIMLSNTRQTHPCISINGATTINHRIWFNFEEMCLNNFHETHFTSEVRSHHQHKFSWEVEMNTNIDTRAEPWNNHTQAGSLEKKKWHQQNKRAQSTHPSEKIPASNFSGVSHYIPKKLDELWIMLYVSQLCDGEEPKVIYNSAILQIEML